jgi:2-dehydropantoate 2-reductase
VNPHVAEQIARDFQQSGIDMQVIPDMLEARWRKLMWNIPYNGLSVALNASTDEMMSNPAATQLVFTIMEEVRAAAKACGKSIEPEFTTKLMEQTKSMVPYDSSMRLDYRAQRTMELEAIYARPIAAANAAGSPMPSVQMLYHQLLFLQSRYARTVS